ncbi:hypothetical protein LTR36_007489 [Oleoguttula mirabilis]|uniref:Cullin family profile domain-containing protein n=1 Tax=Oleoguttula mirabilis TaxID=1507867 RepID=A0AAV9JTM6_9PEZI|nr:hypothetical protein LTR36_007489 [Oleoguttula mirabilis]
MAATAVLSGVQSRHDDVFTSVFPQADYTTPTPESTPNIGVLASPGQPFGGFSLPHNAVEDAVRFNRAWSTATRHLSLPISGDIWQKGPKFRPEVHEAFILLCSPIESRKQLEAWYANEMGVHFRHCVLPELGEWQQPVPLSAALSLFQKTVILLQKSFTQYFSGLTALIISANTTEVRAMLIAFEAQAKQNFHVLVLNSLPQQRLQKTIAYVMLLLMKTSLSHNNNPEICSKQAECRCSVKSDFLPLDQLQAVGLGGNLGERAFALAVHKLLARVVVHRQCFQVRYDTSESVIPKLRRWITERVAPFIEQSLGILTTNLSFKLTDNDRNGFAQTAVSNLGWLRTASLFDYVLHWPETTGAILDIKEYISSNAAEKSRVCSVFMNIMDRRLLHAGPQTTEILSMYTNVIHSFRLLDTKGVMLEKVAGPIRSYLRTRDDTVSIIAASFLADDEKGDVINVDPAKVCPAITVEVSKSSLEDARDHKMLDWSDMHWQPDPIDAGPGYKASKSEDVVAYILGLFDPEEFIKEVTTVLAQHLLQANDPEYVKETRLIELFKSRLDATKLQAAEVMLKDVRDSVSLNKRINPRAKFVTDEPPKPREIQAAIPDEGITTQSLYKMFEHRMQHAQFLATLKLVATRRNDLYFPKRTRLPLEPTQPAEADEARGIDNRVQVLSGFFWPQMRSNDFVLPPHFAEMDSSFGHRFSALGNQRKLHFRRALARVTVELELEDRHVREVDVPAWRASVIDAFATMERPYQDANVEYDPEQGLTAEQLMEALSMEEELVMDALAFWTGKRVLYQKAPATFAVLERLDMDTGMAPQRTTGQREVIFAVMSQDAMLRESAPMFETFIKGMLRDGGPKEVGGFMGVTNMLKMVLPSFTYGEEEVRWLLGEMEGRGEVVRNGEVWAVTR